MVTVEQVRKLMDEMVKHGRIGVAAMRAGMDRKTARKYARLGVVGVAKKERPWRTRADPFADDWPAMAAMLEAAPELEAQLLFEHLMTTRPDRYDPGQVRTFQRRVKDWRAQQGPDREVFFAQCHVPGEATQTDFTDCRELLITISGEPFPHLLCHCVLPYSNWSWATVCRSESMAALSAGLQDAVFRLGRRTTWHQTDNSTAATHNLGNGRRGFNDNYLALMNHLGMKPRTTEVGEKQQNGDVEAANGALKRRLNQQLLLRRSRDFDTVDAYVAWLHNVLERANERHRARLAEELERMTSLAVGRLDLYRELRVTVTSWSTIRVLRNTYSVPSRLIREAVRVRVFGDRVEVLHGDKLQETMPRLHGDNGHRIDYRHVIWSLVRKPGAFRRYRYREDLFPSVVFRRAYDALCGAGTEWRADLDYVRLLHLAASTSEHDVEVALQAALDAGEVPSTDRVREALRPPPAEHPTLDVLDPDLGAYDELLAEVPR